jgi:Na+-driven multidrug efflux pump
MNICGSITMVVMMPIFGINQGAQPILGYNYGAKSYRRVLSAYARAVAGATAICLLGFVAARVASEQLVRLFAPDASDALMAFAPLALRRTTLVAPFIGFQIVSANLFVVTGRPRTSILLALLRQVIVLIPCLILFGRVWGLFGIVNAQPVADAVACAVTGVVMVFELRDLRARAREEALGPAPAAPA